MQRFAKDSTKPQYGPAVIDIKYLLLLIILLYYNIYYSIYNILYVTWI